VYKDDKLIDTIEGENLIVDEGSDLLGSALITILTSDALVQSFGVGTGSGAAAGGDTRATFTNVFIKNTASSAYSEGSKQLTYVFTLEAGEYNGNTIKEFGLFTNGVAGSERLFARRVITGSITKAVDTRVDGIWIIQF
jgi:hypothetical protein